MRATARILDHHELKRAMLCTAKEGCYIFLYDNLADGPCLYDCFLNDMASAKSQCLEDYGIEEDDWTPISDLVPACQQDWISPFRIVGRAEANSQWGEFERLENGRWTPISTEQNKDEREPE